MIKKVERFLFVVTVALKLSIYWRGKGGWIGFDIGSWLEVFRSTRDWSHIPATRDLWASYHPPLSYLIARQVYRFVPDERLAIQLVSTAAVIGAFALLRATLGRLRLLDTLGGVVLLYVFVSLPLIIWFQLEASYDPLVLFWAAATLYLSVVLFWDQTTLWAAPLLVIVLAAGLMTKFSGLFNFGLPPLVLLVRRNWTKIPIAAAVLIAAMLMVAPFYYSHYYKTEHELFPVAMKWLIPDRVQAGVAERRAMGNLAWMKRVLRPTEVGYHGDEPAGDSFTHQFWFMLWKRTKGALGAPPKTVDAIGSFYADWFGWPLLIGSLAFVLLGRWRPKEWNQLGLILLVNSLVLCAALIHFAASYPVWVYLLFKPKYVAIATVWVPFSVATIAMHLPKKKWIEVPVLAAVLAFVIVNHALRVY